MRPSWLPLPVFFVPPPFALDNPNEYLPGTRANDI